jgi:hypothetical protein
MKKTKKVVHQDPVNILDLTDENKEIIVNDLKLDVEEQALLNEILKDDDAVKHINNLSSLKSKKTGIRGMLDLRGQKVSAQVFGNLMERKYNSDTKFTETINNYIQKKRPKIDSIKRGFKAVKDFFVKLCSYITKFFTRKKSKVKDIDAVEFPIDKIRKSANIVHANRAKIKKQETEACDEKKAIPKKGTKHVSFADDSLYSQRTSGLNRSLKRSRKPNDIVSTYEPSAKKVKLEVTSLELKL